jgi:hypothetical protein
MIFLINPVIMHYKTGVFLMLEIIVLPDATVYSEWQ